MTEKKAKSGVFKKFIIALVVIVVVSLGITCFIYYLKYFGPNVTDKHEYLYIHTGAAYPEVYKTIRDSDMVKDSVSFNWAAENMKYISRVKPGRYKLKPGMSNRALINMLASGTQDPVTLSFHTMRLKKQFAAFVSKKIEPDSTAILNLLDSASYLKQYGFTPENVYTMFLPNTYKIYWNSSPERFFKKMNEVYVQYWTAERKQQATDIHLTPIEVSILASIVDAEALHDDEMPTIAGLYLNRLKKGMKLESDPTVIFALQDFTIHRVLNKDLKVISPYNTYMNIGLPPGPVMMPSLNAIDAVLNYQKNDYLYMCAKADFSGYHAFATNIADHLKNAKAFQEALTKRHIMK